jgi:hypothetical protein
MVLFLETESEDLWIEVAFFLFLIEEALFFFFFWLIRLNFFFLVPFCQVFFVVTRGSSDFVMA